MKKVNQQAIFKAVLTFHPLQVKCLAKTNSLMLFRTQEKRPELKNAI